MLTILILTALTTTMPANPLFELKGIQTDSPPVIDGSIEDEAWQDAALADNFIQYEPHRGEPSEAKTQALVMYDSRHLYVAYRVWDSEPPTAQLTRRDADLLNDDSVLLLLDTHNDHQSAYYFITNILGTQTLMAGWLMTVEPWTLHGMHRGSLLQFEPSSAGQ